MATHEIKANLDVDGEVKGTSLDLNGNAQIDGTVTVGVDDTGYDVKFFGATSGKYILWDESENALRFTDNTNIKIGAEGDLQLMHDASNSHLVNYTGDLKITNNANDKDIIFNCDDGSGGNTAYLTLDGSAANMKVAKDMRFYDNVDAEFGDNGDFKIFHDGSNTYLEQINAGTGNIVISNANDDADIIFKSDDGSGGVTEYLSLDGSDSNIKVRQHMVFNDGKAAYFGGGADLSIYHNATNSYILNATGDLEIINGANDKDIIFKCDDGTGGTASYITLDGGLGFTQAQKKIRFIDSVNAEFGTQGDFLIKHTGSHANLTNSTGDIIITNNTDDGDITFKSDNSGGGIMEYFRVDGGIEYTVFSRHARFIDSMKVLLGGSDDLQVYHDGSHSYISQGGTGNLYIQQNTADADLVLQCDDGSGGTTAYLTLDGGNARTRFDKNFRAMDNVKAQFGDSSDLEIYHDSSNSYIKDTGTGSLFLQASDIFLKTNTSENAISCASNGAVTLYYDNAAKLATKSDGVDITGELQADSLDIDGSADISGTTALGGKVTITSTSDSKLNLRTTSGDSSEWNYIDFTGTNGTRDAFIGTDSNGNPLWTRDDGSVSLQLNSNYINASHRLNVQGELEATSLDINGNADISGNLTISSDLTVSGINYGLYHGSVEDGYYFDDYNGSRNLSMILKNQRSDIIRYQPVDNYEYWNGSAWVADASQEANIKLLLDGRQDTGWSVPARDYKFRFTTNQSSGWPIRANIGIQTSWSGSTFEGCQMLVEHYESSSWVLHATMEFGGSGTSNNSNDNGIDNWGLMFKADSALHDGQGSSANTTRITIDFYGWSPSNSSYTTIPLQNIFITSNYAGTENTDYTNLLDHNRDITIPGNIMHEGDTNTYFGFHAADQWRVVTGGSERLEVSNSGLKLGDTGAIVTQILDEDNMATNSATALATQQSIKAYADTKLPLAGGTMSGAIAMGNNNITGGGTITGTTLTGTSLDINGNGDVSGTLTIGTISATNYGLASGDIPNNAANTTGTAAIATTVTVADESSDTSCNVLFTTAATGNLGPKSGTNLTFNSSSGILTATGFAGALTGNVTGNASGSSGSCTGNAVTATTAALATQSTIVANNSANETCYPVFVDGATGAQGLETDTGWTFNPSTGTLTTQKLATDVASIVENNKDGSALMTLTGQGAGNESNISLKMAGTSNGNPIKMKMTALDSSGSSVGAGILSYDADDDSFGIGQSSSHNRMAIKMENTITSPVDGSTYVYYEPTSIKAREYVASSNSSHYDFNGDIMRNGNDTTVRGKMYVFKNGTWTITNADTKLDSNGLLGMALGTNSTTHGMLLKGTFTLDYDPGGAGNPLYISTTDGVASTTVPSTSGHIVRLVGYLIGGTHGNIFFDPDKTYIEVA